MTAKIYRTNTQRPINKRSGKLVWIYNGQRIILLDNKQWDILQRTRTKLKKEPQYAKGILKLEYNFTK